MYDIRDRYVIDLLNGIEAIHDGVISPINKNNPMNNNLFNVFSFFKTAAKLSLKIDKRILRYIRKNTELKVISAYFNFFKAIFNRKRRKVVT